MTIGIAAYASYPAARPAASDAGVTLPSSYGTTYEFDPPRNLPIDVSTRAGRPSAYSVMAGWTSSVARIPTGRAGASTSATEAAPGPTRSPVHVAIRAPPTSH